MLDILIPLGTTALFGFTGSLHCGAMCSAVVGCCQKKTWHYFFARSVSYTILGFLAGYFGVGLFKNFLKVSAPFLSILVASVCLFQVFYIVRPSFFYFSKKNFILNKVTSSILNYSPFSRSATFGIITALLPCGFLYAALLLSVSYAQPLISGASMFVFSLVTMPVLMGGKSIAGFLSFKFDRFKKIFFSILLIAAAIFSLIRGGIFSPENHFSSDVIMCHPLHN